MRKKLIGNSACRYNDKIYFTVYEVNIIGCLDLSTGNINYIFGPTEEPFTQFMLWGDICVWNNSLVVEPYMARSVWIYDLEVEEWEKIITPELPKAYRDYRFVGCQLFEDKLFMIGHNYSNINCLNLRTRESCNILNPNDDDAPGWIRFFGQSMYRRDNFFCVANHLTNHIIKIEFESNKYKWMQIGGNRRNVGIVNDGDYYWIIPDRGSQTLIRWDEKNGSINEYSFTCDISNVWGAAKFGKELYFYGPKDEAVIFDTDNSAFSKSESRIRFAKNFDNEMILWDDTGKMTIRNDDGKVSYNTEIDDAQINRHLNIYKNEIKAEMCMDLIGETKSFGMSNLIALIS